MSQFDPNEEYTLGVVVLHRGLRRIIERNLED